MLTRTSIRFTIAAIAFVALAGCTAPGRTGPVAMQTFDDTSPEQRDGLWEAAQEVLREHHFQLDRVDRRAGHITTQPMTSQHFFEFWRKDVATPYDFAEASMRTVRRSVDVAVAGEGDEATIAVTVKREFIATPERQFNSTIVALRMFGNDLPRADTGERITEADTYWIDAGRDPAMERYLLDRITARAGASAS